ncbi:hypothetical protein OTB20_34710 [Streptomyces sp. H27-H1]|uniref:hypothetical protein n=1 Tax=Streptomyces sp. H27-H1 TaxID=2996461 RepID=UPI00226E296F|nr:hypothetical protein [Streptomyces sp. H27-H1]MCY0931247.1 hypothetical protein [Streptomyces sp. H27-H1]
MPGKTASQLRVQRPGLAEHDSGGLPGEEANEELAVAAGVRATRSLRSGGTPRDVPALVAYFVRGRRGET